jgi:hypothetical protein
VLLRTQQRLTALAMLVGCALVFFIAHHQTVMDGRRALVLGMCVLVFIVLTLDIVDSYRRGSTAGKWERYSRKGRPAQFRQVMISNFVMLALCVGGAVWLIWGAIP